MDAQIKREIEKLVGESRDAIVCSIDKEGYPNAKTMFQKKKEGLSVIWFSTNTSAIRTGQWMLQPKACVYFVNHGEFRGLMLIGDIEVLQDDVSKQALWEPGDEMYYPLGSKDPDYCVLRFTASKGNYYHGLRKHLFAMDELEG